MEVMPACPRVTRIIALVIVIGMAGLARLVTDTHAPLLHRILPRLCAKIVLQPAEASSFCESHRDAQTKGESRENILQTGKS